MTYVIGEPCVDVMDRACVDECPVDCIYEGARFLYIHPDECVDCGACEPVCPVEAIYYEDDLPAALAAYKDDNARFFAVPLPGRTEPLGSPGGASSGVVGVDTELVASLPAATPKGEAG
ncbi:MAG TPA: ferredoxin [Acidothermaceae bacterium]